MVATSWRGSWRARQSLFPGSDTLRAPLEGRSSRNGEMPAAGEKGLACIRGRVPFLVPSDRGQQAQRLTKPVTRPHLHGTAEDVAAQPFSRGRGGPDEFPDPRRRPVSLRERDVTQVAAFCAGEFAPWWWHRESQPSTPRPLHHHPVEPVVHRAQRTAGSTAPLLVVTLVARVAQPYPLVAGVPAARTLADLHRHTFLPRWVDT